MVRSLRRLSRPLLLVALALASALAHAQIPDLSMEQQALMAQQARRQMLDQALAGGAVPLEGALDPTEYVVGPGDVFNVSIGGGVPVQLAATVTADGALVLPEVGSFTVAGLTLAETRERVQERLRRNFRNVETEVALAQPRQFYVHVSGTVDRPGRHVTVPVARVEDAVATAMDG
ncbi:MAG: polysaccharide biosynthesis/export family protein, partial [Rhodothermales bacterium]|nr:polysaccharide biosynthesis/export family protein [Rhodothermales bacterium]